MLYTTTSYDSYYIYANTTSYDSYLSSRRVHRPSARPRTNWPSGLDTVDSTQSGVCILVLVEYGYYAYSYSTLVEYAYSISNMLVVRICMDFRSIASENDVFAYVHLFSPQLVVTHVTDLVRNMLASSQSSKPDNIICFLHCF